MVVRRSAPTATSNPPAEGSRTRSFQPVNPEGTVQARLHVWNDPPPDSAHTRVKAASVTSSESQS
jgi:hypothetical protein